MIHYIDTEFLEGTQKEWFGLSETKPTIDLISIGIVAEDGREYYAISKDFNLKEAWNRYDIKVKGQNIIPGGVQYKEYWIRDNVLTPIYLDLLKIGKIHGDERNHWSFSYKNLKRLIKIYGKTNKEIAEEIVEFINSKPVQTVGKNIIHLTDESEEIIRRRHLTPTFYAYYANYDWVAFCWLFGKMIDLPKGFPMYCIDLKQMLDQKAKNIYKINYKSKEEIQKRVEKRKEIREKTGDLISDTSPYYANWQQVLATIKSNPQYPKQENEHNALDDAKFCQKLHEFLKTQ